MFEIIRATADEAPVLQNLMQLYLYDMSQFSHREVDSRGLFNHEHLDRYWQDESRAAFLARLGGRPAGFALVDEHSVLKGPGAGVRTIADLFVLRNHRRRGRGTHLAIEVFRRFPGRWEVRQDAGNEPAQAFWRKVIDRYTAGRFVELVLDDHRWRGPIQTFDNSLMLG